MTVCAVQIQMGEVQDRLCINQASLRCSLDRDIDVQMLWFDVDSLDILWDNLEDGLRWQLHFTICKGVYR